MAMTDQSRWLSRGVVDVGRGPTASPWVALAVGLLALVWAPEAAAQQRCTGLAATNMVFTGYSPFGPGVAATSTITYSCQAGVTQAWISISRPRTLRTGGNSMPFELYQGADRAVVWPNGTLVPVPPSANGSVTVYGFLPPFDAAAGNYTRSLTVRIYAGASPRQTDSATLRVSTSGFVPACVIGTGALAFGGYDSLGVNTTTPLDGTATFQVACTRGAAYTVGLGPGMNAAGTTRRMFDGTAGYLAYELYSDPGRTSVWSTTATIAGTAASWTPRTLTVYGRVPAGQTSPAGAYADTVQSTINF